LPLPTRIPCAILSSVILTPQQLSIQLYTLRSLAENDPAAVLTKLAELGYRSVEMAGTYGRTAGEFRRLLDDAGLQATSSHVKLNDEIVDTINDALTLGHSFVVVPWAQFDTADEWRRFADELTAAAVLAQQAGISLGYHNHAHEFTQTIDGVRPYELITQNTDPHLVHLEVDLYWAVHAGVDPRDILAANPGRVRQVHVKDRTIDGAMADPGEGVIAFTDLIPMAARSGVIEFIVERDDAHDPYATAETGLAFLRQFC